MSPRVARSATGPKAGAPAWPQRSDLTHYVKIQQSTETNTKGSVSMSWSLYKEAWAAFRRNREGAEQYIAQGVEASAYSEIGIRYISGITRKMRVLYGTRVFNILDIRNFDERNRWLILACQEEDV